MMWPRFGMKVGDSTLCIAYVKADGKIEVIANKDGDRLSQACIYWTGKEIECGLTAKQKIATHSPQVITNSFQLFVPKGELAAGQITTAIRDIPCTFDPNEYVFELKIISNSDSLKTKKMSPHDVHVELFKAQYELAREYINNSDNAVGNNGSNGNGNGIGTSMSMSMSFPNNNNNNNNNIGNYSNNSNNGSNSGNSNNSNNSSNNSNSNNSISNNNNNNNYNYNNGTRNNNKMQQKPIAVLSIPSYYSERAWSLLAKAAEDAGFHVAQIITEHTAAILAYGIGEMMPTQNVIANSVVPASARNILSIKCGDLFSHFALYHVRGGLYSLVDSCGPFNIGGKQFTEAMVEFICHEFYKRFKLNPKENRRSMAKIRKAAADSKHVLTSLQTTKIYIDSLMDGVDFNMQLSRARYESLIQPVINNFLETLNQMMEQCENIDAMANIDDIVLLGATMQIPKLQAAIHARYPDANMHNSLVPGEVVAIGCARQATFLVDPKMQDLGSAENCVCIDTEFLIWHETLETNVVTLIPKGSLIPTVAVVDVPRNAPPAQDADVDVDVDSGDELFCVRVGDDIKRVYLKTPTPTPTATEGNKFKVEVHVTIGGEAASTTPTTTIVMKLNCI